MRLLPVATFVAISSILGTKLAVRFGTKLVVAAGLFSMAAFYLWVADVVEPRTGYGTIAAQMVVLGTGMGLTSAPATEAIMGVVPKAKAGVGSAVNDATRLLGGTLGVAVIGSVYASLYASRLTERAPRGAAGQCRADRARLRRRRAHRRRQLAARRPSGCSRQPSTTPLTRPSSTASTRPTTSPRGVAAAGAVMALALLPAQPTTSRDDTPEVPALGTPATAAAHS